MKEDTMTTNGLITLLVAILLIVLILALVGIV